MSTHEHCWHTFTGPIMIVLRSGQTVEECCKCGETRIVCNKHKFLAHWMSEPFDDYDRGDA